MVKTLVCLLLVAISATTIQGAVFMPVNTAQNVNSPNAAIVQNHVQNERDGFGGVGVPYHGYGGVYPVGVVGPVPSAALLPAVAPLSVAAPLPAAAPLPVAAPLGFGGLGYRGYGYGGYAHNVNAAINMPSNVNSAGAVITQNDVQNQNALFGY